MGSGERYSGDECEEMDKMAMAGMVGTKRINPSHMEILEAKKTDLQRQLNQVNDAIESLKAHPEVVEVLDKLSKVIRRL